MTLRNELADEVKRVFSSRWASREGQRVPESEDLKLSNDAVRLTGTVLYADLSESTSMVQRYKDWFAAEVYKTYLYCAAKIIRSLGGTVTAYDGDRVMAVFIGSAKNSTAAKCGLQIHWAVEHIIRPAMEKQYPKSTYTMKHVVGIDTSDLLVARTGIRGSNDLVWVGRAANYAAKMSTLPPSYETYISADVYSMLKESSKYGGASKRNMWTNLGTRQLGFRIYGSSWWWSIP